ncbi:hypothetical protein GIB67_006763 [Kingdonia uniflora]|uniref:Uncharacterized protein n=1 Tax=Kingdonia uniflora TaxID=39325 RepID=A0A7J7LZ16_9MAGN|nr:hypothetical protein GIB67_006763 [Kingdonia uniflora]
MLSSLLLQFVCDLLMTMDPTCRPSLASNENGSGVFPFSGSDLVLNPSRESSHVVGRSLKRHTHVLTAWKSICGEFVLPEAGKIPLMKSANAMWRGEKGTQRFRYDKHETDEMRKKDCPERTKQEDWDRFVDLTSSAAVKASLVRNNINRFKMVTPHTTGRKGVFRIADEMENAPCPKSPEKMTTARAKRYRHGIIARDPKSKYLDFDHDPLGQVFGRVKRGRVPFMGPHVNKKLIQNTELPRAQMEEEKESYNDLKEQLLNYQKEMDAMFDQLVKKVTFSQSHNHSQWIFVVNENVILFQFDIKCFTDELSSAVTKL